MGKMTKQCTICQTSSHIKCRKCVACKTPFKRITLHGKMEGCREEGRKAKANPSRSGPAAAVRKLLLAASYAAGFGLHVTVAASSSKRLQFWSSLSEESPYRRLFQRCAVAAAGFESNLHPNLEMFVKVAEDEDRTPPHSPTIGIKSATTTTTRIKHVDQANQPEISPPIMPPHEVIPIHTCYTVIDTSKEYHVNQDNQTDPLPASDPSSKECCIIESESTKSEAVDLAENMFKGDENVGCMEEDPPPVSITSSHEYYIIDDESTNSEAVDVAENMFKGDENVGCMEEGLQSDVTIREAKLETAPDNNVASQDDATQNNTTNNSSQLVATQELARLDTDKRYKCPHCATAPIGKTI